MSKLATFSAVLEHHVLGVKNASFSRKSLSRCPKWTKSDTEGRKSCCGSCPVRFFRCACPNNIVFVERIAPWRLLAAAWVPLAAPGGCLGVPGGSWRLPWCPWRLLAAAWVPLVAAWVPLAAPGGCLGAPGGFWRLPGATIAAASILT